MKNETQDVWLLAAMTAATAGRQLKLESNVEPWSYLADLRSVAEINCFVSKVWRLNDLSTVRSRFEPKGRRRTNKERMPCHIFPMRRKTKMSIATQRNWEAVCFLCPSFGFRRMEYPTPVKNVCYKIATGTCSSKWS